MIDGTVKSPSVPPWRDCTLSLVIAAYSKVRLIPKVDSRSLRSAQSRKRVPSCVRLASEAFYCAVSES